MKAITCDRFGRADDVLLRLRASGVNPSDVKAVRIDLVPVCLLSDADCAQARDMVASGDRAGSATLRI